jgi:hypothetical protein
MSRYCTIVLLTIILIYSLPAASFGLDGKAAFDKKDKYSDSFCYQDSYTYSNNEALYRRFPMNVFTKIYEAISRVDGNRCSMYPTCSHYAIEAVEKHGLLIGIVMTCDRLIHESNEMDYSPLVEVGDSLRYADPVENNDFWWSD